jgi:hypothetical protein
MSTKLGGLIARFADHLARRGFSSSQLAAVTSDVEIRLRAILSRWRNEPLRRALIFHGVEESVFYSPTGGDLDIRALVVVGIRNSLLEDFASTAEAARRWGATRPLLSDFDVRKITEDVLEYMLSLDLPGESSATVAPPPDLDPFANLVSGYPLAFRAMSEAANMIGATKAFPPLPASSDSILGAVIRETNDDMFTSVSVSGIDGRIDRGLGQAMANAVASGAPFMIFPCFKGCTRNPEKLYRVLNDLFNHGLAFITPNYFLSNGYVARRSTLLPPCHSDPEFFAQLADRSGLKPRHREALELAARSLSTSAPSPTGVDRQLPMRRTK